MDCVDRPEEVVVLKMRQRRRQQKLSGHNAYFESLKQTPKPKKDEITKSEAKSSNAPPKRQGFSTRNYFDSMSSTSSSSTTESSSAASTPKKKEPEAPKITSRKLSGASNYLDNINASPTTVSSSKNDSEPTNMSSENKKNEKVVSESKLPQYEKGKPQNTKKPVTEEKKKTDKATKTEPVQRRAFSSSSFLENLSVVSVNATNAPDSKVTQSTESSRNPYLEEKTKEYELSIDPPALVRRILSVRELISKEWVEDLEMLLKLNDDIAESFDEYNSKAETKFKVDDDEIKNITSSKEPVKKPTKQALPGDEKREKVFDRSIISTWSQTLWSPKRSSSPFRKANFDLLLLLATQESIHCVLNSYKNDDSVRPQTHEWLLDFYVDNVNEYFDGHQTYARSEDFLEEMSKSPRTLIETNNNNVLAWTDPAIIAEDIVRERSEVILGWIKVAKNILEEHTDLRRLLFTNMVSKSFPDEALSDFPILDAVKKETTNSTNSNTEVFGAFE